ncbi:hypothetical protein [Tenacibaculum ovolyticum]|uniref:hypothetical protein n=1 Tax=Tenacibaculum ovolyticum TaxID=104270 RepID=UPI00040F236D|nr:hypothetical protein [Tenacibaculum ovolyticum]
MKKIFMLLIFFLVISCNSEKTKKAKTTKTATKPIETVDNFDWLLGKWKRTNEVVGKETFENWKKISKTEYIGFSYTTQNTDTIYQEKFKLIKSNDNWDFEIQLKGELTPSSFKMTSSNSKEFICQNNLKNYPNKKLDSPNKIKYWKKGDEIYATISGKKINIQLDFEKIK